jgi:hypothetical protein
MIWLLLLLWRVRGMVMSVIGGFHIIITCRRHRQRSAGMLHVLTLTRDEVVLFGFVWLVPAET